MDTGAPSEGGLPQFNPEWFASQIFWLGVTFVLLYVFFGRVILPRIQKTIEYRQQKMASDMAQADGFAKKAHAARESYEKTLAAAREQATAELRATETALKAKTDTAMDSFRQKMTASLTRTQSALATERARLAGEMNDIAAEAAAHAASKILQAPADLEQARHVVTTLQKARAA